MVRQIKNRLYRVNLYGVGYVIFEVDDDYDEETKKIREEIRTICPGCIGYKLNLFVQLAKMNLSGYIVISVTEFNPDGSKPKVSYANNKDFKKIVKYLEKKEE